MGKKKKSKKSRPEVYEYRVTMVPAKRPLRPLGAIMEDMEKHLEELTDEHSDGGHGMQRHEVEALVHGWLEMHAPQSEEEFTDGTKPVRYYGHRDGLK